MKNNNISFMYGNPRLFRHKMVVQKKMELPKKAILIENLPKGLSTYLMQVLLETFHEPENLKVENGRPNEMFSIIAEFKSIGEAAEVLSNLHNQKVDDKQLQVSFHGSIAN